MLNKFGCYKSTYNKKIEFCCKRQDKLYNETPFMDSKFNFLWNLLWTSYLPHPPKKKPIHILLQCGSYLYGVLSLQGSYDLYLIVIPSNLKYASWQAFQKFICGPRAFSGKLPTKRLKLSIRLLFLYLSTFSF